MFILFSHNASNEQSINNQRQLHIASLQAAAAVEWGRLSQAARGELSIDSLGTLGSLQLRRWLNQQKVGISPRQSGDLTSNCQNDMYLWQQCMTCVFCVLILGICTILHVKLQIPWGTWQNEFRPTSGWAKLSSVQNPCWLMIGEYTIQHVEDYQTPWHHGHS